MPPSVEYCKVPPEPLTLPIAIEPPLTTQALQVLLVIASVPVGAEGVTQVPGTVVPTLVVALRQPLVANTLAIMV